MEDFEIEIIDDVAVIGVNLNRATLNEAAAFREKVEVVINLNHTKYIIDVSKCDFIDSTFFGAIVIAFKLIKSKDYRLKVVEPANTGEDIFTTRNFRRLFDLYKTREDAIKSFESDSQPNS